VFGRRSAEFVKFHKKSMVPEKELCSALHKLSSKFRISLLTGRQAANYCSIVLSKGKAVPLQAWGGPEGFRKLRFPDILTTAQDGGKVVSLTHRPHLPPGNTPGTHFC
jgi:hypothetical protein